MAAYHRRKLTKDRIEKGILTLRKRPDSDQTQTALAEILNVPYADLRARMKELEIPPLRSPLPEITREQIETVIEEIKQAGGLPTITAVSLKLSVSAARLKRAWEAHGFPEPKRGRPLLPRTEDEIDQAIREWQGDGASLGRKLGLTREAIRQRRERLGLLTDEQERKRKALFELLEGGRPAVVAIHHGFTTPTCKRWFKELQADPVCLVKPDCVRKAKHKLAEGHIAPAACTPCHERLKAEKAPIQNA